MKPEDLIFGYLLLEYHLDIAAEEIEDTDYTSEAQRVKAYELRYLVKHYAATFENRRKYLNASYCEDNFSAFRWARQIATEAQWLAPISEALTNAYTQISTATPDVGEVPAANPPQNLRNACMSAQGLKLTLAEALHTQKNAAAL